MGRLITFLYGLVSYVVFFITFLYAIGFVSDLVVPKTIDTGTIVSSAQAFIVNLVLMSVFAIQHSVMARKQFKRWWTQFVPKAIERSTYVLLSSLALLLLFWQWRSMPGVVWNVGNTLARDVLWALCGLGFAVVLFTTCLINHFDLFGLRQVYLNLKRQPYTSAGFRTPLLYRLVRHPLMLGFIIAFWATPIMTVAHLVFSVATTAYILIAVQFEERDLAAYFGSVYEEYRGRVPMLLPWLRSRR